MTPSTQVLQQLIVEDANMAHCKLARRGATALGAALAVNTRVKRLNLSENMLDGKSMEEIIKGIMTATGAKLQARQRNLEAHMKGFETLDKMASSQGNRASPELNSARDGEDGEDGPPAVSAELVRTLANLCAAGRK